MGADQSQVTQAFTPDFADGEVASRRRTGLANFSRIEWAGVGVFFAAWAVFLAWSWLF
jgi:hypothetical protein